MARDNEPVFELVERFMPDQCVVLRNAVMDAIEKAILNGMSREEVEAVIRALMGCEEGSGRTLATQ